MTRLHPLVFVVLLAACGGSAGFQQVGPRPPVSVEPVINDDQVQRAFELQAQLPKPYRMGVLFRDTAPTPNADARAWRWEPEHRTQLMKALEALEGKGEVGTVVSIARAAVAGDDLHAIRVAAARQGLDAVLVVTGSDAIERDMNGWATTYLAVLPMLFAPGSELRVDFTTHAELWDVRNEYLYLAAEAEARAEQARAIPYIDVEEASAKAQTESLDLLVHELEKRFAKLHGAS
jgi:hypothetical protein